MLGARAADQRVAPRPDEGELPDAAYGAALATLPLSPRRLAALVLAGPPVEVWTALRSGRVPPTILATLGPQAATSLHKLGPAARSVDVASLWRAVLAVGARVHVLGRADYPAPLAGDHEAPGVLFSLGSVDALDRPRVAIVGTRRATHYGRDVARELGRDLAAAGIAVVSGLALGIDGAAHEGALAAAGPPVAVVGSGVDVVYPAAHAALWRRVASCGLLLSEAPLGARPDAWRFPARNRILAALAHVVVVVESHQHGGALLTVRAAAERGVTVMAVPGSVRSSASTGTNALLADGAEPVRGADDVVVALSLAGADVRPPRSTSTQSLARGRPGLASDGLDPAASQVLEAVDWSPTTTETVLRRTGLDLGRAATLLTRLEVEGLVQRSGGWWHRVSPS